MGMSNEQYNSVLRSMLFNARKAKTMEEILAVIESACDEDTIAAVEKRMREWQAKEKAAKS